MTFAAFLQELSRVRRLELEIQILKAENEELKIVGFRDASEKLQRLEKENKQLTVTMQQLESSHTKDAEFNVNLTKENNKVIPVVQHFNSSKIFHFPST